ncbi:MAG: hypothetical protein A3A57_01135 [Candidatus Woykebacteria bacterium RIFCSPLOWO2_01_FULL_41_12]|uniref:Replication-associated protein G2P N-terminal domain-containing protein n=1 Tax=Candidatus Woykebacteria bacterium RIFCSPLOWO2_01_FULL_41_12 TaxID=1802604 RepID=A0A1G1WT18_9BACT|nr:MAG: hypothetical protein A3A57_01135 [Candidatus Woykebacteria bacterium RIFCSPLOWO2_01_FULL_41_12]
MLDTITITMNNIGKIITKPEAFTPPLQRYGDTYFVDYRTGRHTLNHHSELTYYPSLTVTSGWKDRQPIAQLKISFSVTKLLYQNNVDELGEEDFSLIFPTLQKRLQEIGVIVTEEEVKNAPVMSVHFSKNLLIKDTSTTAVIDTLRKGAITHRLEVNIRDFKDYGKALYLDNGSFQIVIYDKVADAFRSLRHASDKDRTSIQQNLLKSIRKSHQPIEILRFEVRIPTKRQLNYLLQKLGFNQNLRLSDLFNYDLAEKMLMYHWDILVPIKSRFLLKFPESDTLSQVIGYEIKNHLKLNTWKSLGIALLIYHQREYGARNLEATLTSLYSRRTWYRLSKESTTLINNLTNQSESFTWAEDIEQAFEHYAPFKVKSLEVINNNNGFATPQKVN